jgi:hypothetical protein
MKPPPPAVLGSIQRSGDVAFTPPPEVGGGFHRSGVLTCEPLLGFVPLSSLQAGRTAATAAASNTRTTPRTLVLPIVIAPFIGLLLY